MACWLHEWYRPGRFHRQLGKVLDEVVEATLERRAPRVCLAAPPRHGKSVLVGQAMSALFMAVRPGGHIFYATSDEGRAGDVSRAVFRAVQRLYAADPVRFAHLKPSKEKWSPLDWESEGGNRWVAKGITGSTGGIGAHLLIVDDATGTSAKATSKAHRDQVWRCVEEDGLSRIMDGGGAVIMETRRHVDDVRGRIDASAEYRAVFESYDWECQAGPDAANRPHDGRREGQWLWDDGHGLPYGQTWYLRSPQLHGNSPLWERVYQQRPGVEGGTVFREQWLRYYSEDPRDMAGLMDELAFSVDLATGRGESNDWSVAQVWGRRGADRYLLAQWRDKVGLHQRVQAVRQLAQDWRCSFGLVENKASGLEVVELLRSHVVGIQPFEPGKYGSKVQRALAASYSWAAGQVYLPDPDRHPWVSGLTNELLAFTEDDSHRHDDQIDPMSQLFIRWRSSDGHGVGAGHVDMSDLWDDLA